MKTKGRETIRLINVEKVYGEKNESVRVRALYNVNLSFRSGKMYAIMGPSGSGKSTLMHILGLLDRPTTGTYLLNGQNASSMTETNLALMRSREIGFVFQSFNLLPRYSVYKNVEMPLMYSHYDNRDHRQIINTLLGQVGLSHREQHKPAQLSGGEKQRVAIARALVNDPSIILADEPTGNLDSKTEKEIMRLFTSLKDEDRTIILVTHNDDVAHYADEVITIRDGEVE